MSPVDHLKDFFGEIYYYYYITIIIIIMTNVCFIVNICLRKRR